VNPTIDLTGRVALVTGASKGIGAAIAAALSAAGAAVMLSSRKQDGLDAAAATMPGEVATFAANAGEPEAAQACVAATLERFGGLDILVNNAATSPHMGPLIDIDLGRFDKTVQVNLRGPLVWTQAAHRAAMGVGGGVVLNVASIGGLRHDGGIGAYNVTKAGLIHLTHVLALELGPGIRVNAIAPGLVRTDFARVLVETVGDATAARLPLRRLGLPEDIAGAALWLVSDLAAWVTGHTLVVDGGAVLQ
jgi:NAD(P)-dependent dehydrogenase (short-subunit alcohol dehydrogenase family)